MNAPAETPGTTSVADLLAQVQSYLAQRARGLTPARELEAAWKTFFDVYSGKIRKFAFTCGAAEEDVPDCMQDVWAELLRRLPTFRLDPKRGKFDTWLFHVVRGKTADLHRRHQQCSWEGNGYQLHSLATEEAGTPTGWIDREMFAAFWQHLRGTLSECNFQILYLRLVEERPVSQVAQHLGISDEQVWYRYHRARRQMEQIAGTWLRNGETPSPVAKCDYEKLKKGLESAQGNDITSVSRSVAPGLHAAQGGNCVDYVFQRLELGRRDSTPEWKVEWDCNGLPKPVLYIRKSAMVAYAELCGSEEFINGHWPQIVNAAIAAGVAAGIATIISTPSAALPIFHADFYKQLQARCGAPGEKIQVALSSRQEPNGPWCVCKD